MMKSGLFQTNGTNMYLLLLVDAFVENVVKLSWHTSNKYPIHFNPRIKINDMDRVDPTVNETCNGDYPLFRGKGIIPMCIRLVLYRLQTIEPSK